MPDLAVIIVSYNSRNWLVPCLTSVYAHAGDAELDVVVVDNDSGDGSAELVEAEFPQARVIRAENHGFASGNNRGMLATNAPFVLLLNPDAEITEGTLGALLEELRERPALGVVGCRQRCHNGSLFPTIRRFPNAGRLLWEALGSEHLPLRASWLGQRELNMAVYSGEVSCDWCSGAFLLIRREALLAAGLMDERFFLYFEEPDLCLRIKRAGWDVRHLPSMTIRHPWDREGLKARLVAQEAYAARQYMAKHFTRTARWMGILALALGHARRGAVGGREVASRKERRRSSRLALRTLLGIAPPPFGPPPTQSLSPGATREAAPLEVAR